MTRNRGRNGGSWGKNRTTDQNSQSGIWGLFDAHQLRHLNIWGYVAPPAAPEFNWRYYAYGSGISNGRTVVIWRQTNGTVNILRTVIGQQHTGFTQTWNSYSEDLSSYSGTTGRIYIGYKTGNSFYNDPQYDNMELVDTTSGTISLDPGTATGRNRWERYTSYTTSSTPPTNSYTPISISTGTSNLWNYDVGGTPSGSTGGTRDADGSSSGYYLYFEGSSPNNSSSTRYYWVRMTGDYTLL